MLLAVKVRIICKEQKKCTKLRDTSNLFLERGGGGVEGRNRSQKKPAYRRIFKTGARNFLSRKEKDAGKKTGKSSYEEKPTTTRVSKKRASTMEFLNFLQRRQKE